MVEFGLFYNKVIIGLLDFCVAKRQNSGYLAHQSWKVGGKLIG